MAEIGGFKEVMVSIVGGLYFFFNRRAMSKYLLKKIYFENESDPEMITKEEYKSYQENLEENFNFVNLVKSTNALKVLNMANFQKHHVILLPRVLRAIKKEEQDKLKAKLSLSHSNTEFRKAGLEKPSKKIIEESIEPPLTEEQAIQILFSKNHTQKPSTYKCHCQCGASKIDEIFKTYVNMYSEDELFNIKQKTPNKTKFTENQSENLEIKNTHHEETGLVESPFEVQNNVDNLGDKQKDNSKRLTIFHRNKHNSVRQSINLRNKRKKNSVWRKVSIHTTKD